MTTLLASCESLHEHEHAKTRLDGSMQQQMQANVIKFYAVKLFQIYQRFSVLIESISNCN